MFKNSTKFAAPRFIYIWMLAGFILFPIVASANEEEVPQELAPSGKPWEPAWGFWPHAPTAWGASHWRLVKKAQAGNVEVLFLGDSITHAWMSAGKEIWSKEYEPLKGLNIGISGDTTRQTLWRLEHKAMDGIQPRVVVLMIGINNVFTHTGTDEEIAEGISVTVKKILELSPSSKVLLLGILPLGNEPLAARARNINGLIAKLAGPSVTFLDMGPKFVDATGKADPTLYNSDIVHLAAPGYARWSETMRSSLDALLK